MITFDFGLKFTLNVSALFSWAFIVLLLGLIISFFRKRIWSKFIFNHIVSNAKICWYSILIVIVYSYCCKHWEKVVVFSPFSGESLMLIVTVVLSIFPFVHEIEGCGFTAKFNKTFTEVANSFKKNEEDTVAITNAISDLMLKKDNKEQQDLVKEIEEEIK